MNDLIKTHDSPAMPPANNANAICQRTTADTPGFLRRVCDFFRQNIGLKPLYLTERAAEAEVRRREAVAESLEIENKAKAIEVQSKDERHQMEIFCMKLDTEAKHAKAMAEVAAMRAVTESQRIQNRMHRGISNGSQQHRNNLSKSTELSNSAERTRAIRALKSKDAQCGSEQDTGSS